MVTPLERFTVYEDNSYTEVKTVVQIILRTVKMDIAILCSFYPEWAMN